MSQITASRMYHTLYLGTYKSSNKKLQQLEKVINYLKEKLML